MIAPKEHDLEIDRIRDLNSYSILDTLPEVDYDNITAIAAEICNTEISLISLIDDKRQWFKSHHGLAASETPKEYAFCAHAINDQNNIFIVQDARIDTRFHDNPLVTGEPYVIFYVGVPLISDNGLPLGTLCVIDHQPKSLNDNQIKSLSALANQVMNILNLRKTKLILEKALAGLEERNEELERFAYVAAHDLKSPLIGISQLSKLLQEQYASQINHDACKMLHLIEGASEKLRCLIDGLLEYSKSENVLNENKVTISLGDLKIDLLELFTYEHDLTLNLNSSIEEIVVNKAALYQILINLVANAIKYDDKKDIRIEIGVYDSSTHYEFYVQDNGPGIPLNCQETIFKIFSIIASKDRYGKHGNGIGLATVKKIVEKCGGTIKVESELGNGSKFSFSIQK